MLDLALYIFQCMTMYTDVSSPFSFMLLFDTENKSVNKTLSYNSVKSKSFMFISYQYSINVLFEEMSLDMRHFVFVCLFVCLFESY